MEASDEHGEAAGDGCAAGLDALPPTVAFFELPPARRSAGFVLDFGQAEAPPDLSPRRNSSGPLELITLLPAETPAQDVARWWQRSSVSALASAAAPAATASQDPHGVMHTLTLLQLELLGSRFHAVPVDDIRSTYEHFVALSLANRAHGELAVQRQQLPELLHLIGLRLNLKMGGQATDPFRFRDVLRILQALRDEDAMMQIPVSPMPAGGQHEEDEADDDLVMYTNALFTAMKRQRGAGEVGAGVLELSGSGAAMLLLPVNSRLERVEISRALVEAHVALRCIVAEDQQQSKQGQKMPVAFETLSGDQLELDGDMLRISESSALPSAGSTLQVLEREQFYDEDCKRHEVLWISDSLTTDPREAELAALMEMNELGSPGSSSAGRLTTLQAYTLFDQRSSYQEQMAFLYVFTPTADSPGSLLGEAVKAAAQIRQGAEALLAAIMGARQLGGADGAPPPAAGGRKGRRRSLDGLSGKRRASLTIAALGGKKKDSSKEDPEEALTARLGTFVGGARALQLDAAARVARSLMDESRKTMVQNDADSGRQLISLRSAVSAFIAEDVHRVVLQVLRRAYEHEDIALAAKVGVWKDISDEAMAAAALPPRPTGFDLSEGARILNGLEDGATPEEQLLIVKKATWAVKGAQSLPADDLLPLFVELLAQACPPYLFSTLCYINFFYVPVSGAADELSYHATNLRAAAAIIGLRCPWEAACTITEGEGESESGSGGGGGDPSQDAAS